MEYSPELLARLTLEGVFLGASLGVLYALFRALRILFGGTVGFVSRIAARLWAASYPLIGPFQTPERRNRSLRFSDRIRTFLFDLLFCLAAALGILLLAFVGNEGRIRWFLLCGTIGGFLAVRGRLGFPVLCGTEILAVCFRVSLRYLAFFALFPLRSGILFFARCGKRVVAALREKSERKREIRYAKTKKLRLAEEARTGFGCPCPPFDASAGATKRPQTDGRT